MSHKIALLLQRVSQWTP